MENSQPITPAKRVVEVLIDENDNPTEGEVVKKVLTFETLDLPTLDEVVGKTEPDYDDFEVLLGKMGACDELTEFTKVFYYKEKVDPPVNGKDYRIKQLPKYPKFLALFEGKETINDITLFDVNRMFNKEQFGEALEVDERKNALADAAAEIMDNMKKENRFSFDAELKESDLAILKKWIKNTDGFLSYDDLLADSFREILRTSPRWVKNARTRLTSTRTRKTSCSCRPWTRASMAMTKKQPVALAALCPLRADVTSSSTKVHQAPLKNPVI